MAGISQSLQSRFIDLRVLGSPTALGSSSSVWFLSLISTWRTISSVDRSRHHLETFQELDPDLVKRIGAATALEVRATGIPYASAPCIAVCRDPRWGRCYESYSEDHKVVQTMMEIIPGLQGDLPKNYTKGLPYVGGKDKVVACAKHFVGDGGTHNGINENNTIIDAQGLSSIHMPAYYNSIAKGVSTVMVSYSSWNGVKMHANRDLVTGFLKNKLRFKGFVISDWQGIDRITTPPGSNYTYSVQAGGNAGIDMTCEEVPLWCRSSELICIRSPVVKQRMQTGQFASAPDAVRLIVAKEGFKGL